MNILMLSIDRNIFDENSAVRQRMFSYGTLVNELHIIILNKDNPKPKVGQGTEDHFKKKTKIANNVWVYPTNSSSKFRYFFDAIKIAIRIKEIDLVTAQDPYETGFIAWRIAKKLNSKLELQIHTDLFNIYFIKHSFSNRIRSLIAKFLLPKADHIRAVSKRIKLSLSKKLQEKTTVLPIFVDTVFIHQKTSDLDLHKDYPRFKFIILIMSRLEKEKNISIAVETMKEIVRVFPKTGLIIVGKGSMKKTLRKQARRTGLEENIIFKRWANDPISYFKSADLFLSTSDYEGYGLSLVEAIISRCPILTTKVGIVGELLNSNNSLLCDVGDKECLVDNIIRAQQHPETLSEFKEKAYADFIQKIPQIKNEYLKNLQKIWEGVVNLPVDRYDNK
ncbi:MAG: glycosyltransferase [Candidatus Pacebacteria bacterium]|nr:glycosyltransferase [Candidatus Paceibacterota bacterium]